MKARVLLGMGALAVATALGSQVPWASAAAGRPAARAGQASGSSASAPHPNISAVAAASWQTNSTVWALAYTGGTVYVGGDFSSVRPPGDAAGIGEVPRTHLAAFNASTGALVTAFDPVLDGGVSALAVSPDGKTLYVGGSFTHVGTSYRDHLAAFSTSTGALSATWHPSAGSPVLSIAPAAHGSDIYIGGDFTMLDGSPRTFAGEVDSAGSLQPWAPNLNAPVTSVAVAANDSRVLVGGYFSQFNGVPQQGVVDVDPTTGGTNNLISIEPNIPGCSAAVKDIVIGNVSAQNPAGTAYIASEGTGSGCFDGDWAASVATGALVWQNDCLGATQSLVIIGDWLYKGSHAHDCDYSPGGFPQVTDVDRHLLDQQLGSGALGHWTPNTNFGSGLGPRVMATDGRQLFLGGEFTTVNGRPQQGLARFGPGPGTTRPARPAAPTVISTSKGVDSLAFPAISTADVGTLKYSIYRDGGKQPIGTMTATSWPWALPVLHYRDAGLRPGSKHTYQVAVGDGAKTSARSPASRRVTVSSRNPPYSYVRTVLRAGPSFFWRLDQLHGSVAADSSPHHFDGTYEPGTTKGVPGPIPGIKVNSTVTQFNGTTGLMTAQHNVSSPGQFSIEGWFKTSTDTGGKLIGLGGSQTGSSSSYDRQIYLMNDGQLVFGLYDGHAETVESPHVYNDGRWHYVVATVSTAGSTDTMALYVDGVLIGARTTGLDQTYRGYWRIGGDNLSGWSLDPLPNSQRLTEPNSYYVSGSIGDVAIYPYALSATRVAAHYRANSLSH